MNAIRLALVAVALALLGFASSGCTIVAQKELGSRYVSFGQVHRAWLGPGEGLVVAYRMRDGRKDPHIVTYRGSGRGLALEGYEEGEAFEPPPGAREIEVHRVEVEAPLRPYLLDQRPDGPGAGGPVALIKPAMGGALEPPARFTVPVGGQPPVWSNNLLRVAVLPLTLALDAVLSPVYVIALAGAGGYLLVREIQRAL